MIKANKKQVGFTLIEVLVVVSILLVLTSILIPRLRVINKERGIRETARITGSIFSQASQRAIADGVAGVLLKHNPNFANDTGYSFAVSNLSLLRAVPPFTGDQAPAPMIGAYQSGTAGTVTIPFPLEQTDLEIIKAGDSISFAQSSVRYTIQSVAPSTSPLPSGLDLVLDVSFLPDPNSFVEPMTSESGTAYVIHRLPRVLQSSEVTLPPNYVIDMRFSGFSMLDSGFTKQIAGNPPVRRLPIDGVTGEGAKFLTTIFEPNPRLFLQPPLHSVTEVVDFSGSDIAILFNEKGELDRMVRLASDQFGNTHLINELAGDNLQLFIAELITEADGTDPEDNPLNSETNLWVTVNRSTGSVNVGYNSVATPGSTLNQLFDNPDPNQTLYYGADFVSARGVFNGAIGEARGFSIAQTAGQ